MVSSNLFGLETFFIFWWLILACFLMFLVLEILHVDKDVNAVFVWDGTDAPPASILAKWVLNGKKKGLKSSDDSFWVVSLHEIRCYCWTSWKFLNLKFSNFWLVDFKLFILYAYSSSFFDLAYNVWLSTGELKKTRHLAVSQFILYCQEIYFSAFQLLERSWEFL